MRTLALITAVFILLFGSVASRGANLDKISAETGVPVATLQAERASTGLGWGGLEKAHLLANASGQSFDTIVGKFQGHEGWGQIAHDYGLNLGKVVSGAHRSSQAAAHAKETQTVHGKRTARTAHTGFHGTHGMGRTGGMGHGMGGMGHGGHSR
jgi:hypothetical protein